MLATAATVVTAGTAYGVSSSDVQANSPQVAGDATSNTTARFPTNKQNEPTISRDPVSGVLLAGSNDEQLQPPCGPGPVRGATAARNDCSFVPNVGTSGVYRSTDGSSWTNLGLLRGYSDYGDGGSLVSDGDPVIVFGPKPNGAGGFTYASGARAYYANLASYASGAATGQQAPELLAVSRSDNDGSTWSAPVVAASANGYVFNDKENIWVDANPSSPYFGRAYISWTQFRDLPGCAEPIMFAYSTDGGSTWSLPNQITSAHNCGLGGRQGSAIRSGPDGTVYLEWEDSDQSGPIQAIATSHDGGATFSHGSKIANVDDLADPIPGSNFRTDSFASIAVDSATGAVYVAGADELGAGAGRIVVAKSPAGGGTWSTSTVSTAREGYAFYQGLDVAPNGRVDVAYQAQKQKSTLTYGTGNASVGAYYVSSTDRGATWSRPTAISASSDPAASAQNNLARQFWGDYATLVSSNANAWFIFTDARNGIGCAAVDAYQHGVDGSGPAVAKPAPEDVCGSQFGNTDAYVSMITP